MSRLQRELVSVSDDIPILVCFSELPSITKLKKIYTQHQIPLQWAHASTVHKFQGQTAKHPLILYRPDIGEYTSRGLEYIYPVINVRWIQ